MCNHELTSAITRIAVEGLTAVSHCDICDTDLGILPRQTAELRAAGDYRRPRLPLAYRAHCEQHGSRNAGCPSCMAASLAAEREQLQAVAA